MYRFKLVARYSNYNIYYDISFYMYLINLNLSISKILVILKIVIFTI